MNDKAQTKTAAPETETQKKARAFTLQRITPSPSVLSKELVAKGKGARLVVGRLYGFVTDVESKPIEVVGKMFDQIVLRGIFQVSSDVVPEATGEAVSAILPHLYAETVAKHFEGKTGLRIAKIDCDLIMEATGGKPSFRWVAIDHADKDFDILSAMKARS